MARLLRILTDLPTAFHRLADHEEDNGKHQTTISTTNIAYFITCQLAFYIISQVEKQIYIRKELINYHRKYWKMGFKIWIISSKRCINTKYLVSSKYSDFILLFIQ